jgi:hypothetical protein
MYEFAHNYNSSLCSILQPGAVCTDTVWFIPLYSGVKSATLVISSNDSHKPDQTVVLTGTAVTDDNSIAGKIWDETGIVSINKSQVVLIPQSDITDTTAVNLNGPNSYVFQRLPAGKFTILAIPDPVAYPDELPTYYGDNILLNNALWLQASGVLEGKDIRLIKKPATGTGTGVINGHLVSGSSKKGISVTEKTDDTKGNPLPGIYVYLKRASDGRLIAYCKTDYNGWFSFPGLEDGSYIFVADYRGKPMDPVNPPLTINSSRKEIEILATAGIETITITDLPTGIDLTAGAAIRIFPVPASEKITVQIPEGLFSGESILLRITDLSGKYQYINELNDFHSYILTIDVSGMKDGLYIIEIGNKGKSLRNKFLIIR